MKVKDTNIDRVKLNLRSRVEAKRAYPTSGDESDDELYLCVNNQLAYQRGFIAGYWARDIEVMKEQIK